MALCKSVWRHDIQHNDSQHNHIQRNDIHHDGRLLLCCVSFMLNVNYAECRGKTHHSYESGISISKTKLKYHDDWYNKAPLA